jgi:hypothetical protein
MKKYIFTESQIKTIIDNQINEQVNPSMGSSVTLTLSGAISDRSFYDGVVKKLRTQTCTVLTVKGKPSKGKMLITPNMMILPHDAIRFNVGDEILIAGTTGSQATLYVQNGKLIASVVSD